LFPALSFEGLHALAEDIRHKWPDQHEIVTIQDAKFSTVETDFKRVR
jgi:hypothetical protein